MLIFLKIFIYPFRYKKGSHDYDAEKYWRDRFSKYGMNIKGAGDEGDSKKNNIKRYERVKNVFKGILKNNIKSFADIKVLEIGVGSGSITDALKELGVLNYQGVDITSVLFDSLGKKYEKYKFSKLDVTSDNINDKYDLIVIIDVIEHIVDEQKFSFAINNIKNSLKNGGFLIIAPVVEKNHKSQFYERHWALADIKNATGDFKICESKVWEENFSKIYLLQ